MVVIQEMCARIGLVTGKGFAANLRKHVPRSILWFCTILLVAANTFNIGADLGAMAASTRLLFPSIPFLALLSFFTIGTILLEVLLPYRTYAKYLKWLTFSLFAYAAAAFAARVPWMEVASSIIHPYFSNSPDWFIIVAATLGTTISPYLFFWQTSEEIEDEISKGKTSLAMRQGASASEIRQMRRDVWSGMTASNLAMFFIIATCAFTLHTSGITTISTAEEAAAALAPLAGSWASLWFTLGIVGVGLLGVPILAASAAYAIAESMKWKEGLYLPYAKARSFYGVIIAATAVGFFFNLLGFSPIRILILSAVANAVAAPPLILAATYLTAKDSVMGRWKNPTWLTAAGILLAVIMALAGYFALRALFM
jgi:Mn2+/Fe2+ NRAMP family transporter